VRQLGPRREWVEGKGSFTGKRQCCDLKGLSFCPCQPREEQGKTIEARQRGKFRGLCLKRLRIHDQKRQQLGEILFRKKKGTTEYQKTVIKRRRGEITTGEQNSLIQLHEEGHESTLRANLSQAAVKQKGQTYRFQRRLDANVGGKTRFTKVYTSVLYRRLGQDWAYQQPTELGGRKILKSGHRESRSPSDEKKSEISRHQKDESVLICQ